MHKQIIIQVEKNNMVKCRRNEVVEYPVLETGGLWVRIPPSLQSGAERRESSSLSRRTSNYLLLKVI